MLHSEERSASARLILISLLVAGCGAAPAAPPATTSRPPVSEGDHVLDVGGVKLAYHVRGTGPLCIVHAGGPGVSWSYMRMPLVEKELRLVYLEPAGTGASSALHDPKAYTFTRYAELLDGFRAALGVDKPCVLGHSYGGYITLHWAVAHPDHVGALILYDTAAASDADHAAQAAALKAFAGEPWFAAASAADEDKTTSDEEANAVVHAEAPLMFADWTHHQSEYASALADTHAYVEPLHGATATRAPWDLRARLGAVHAPTLVIVGARDWITSPKRAKDIVDALPGATLATLPNSAHLGHIEEPAAFAAAIHGFVPRLR